MPNQAEDVARRWFEDVWNQRRAETIDELLTADSVCHADEGRWQARKPSASGCTSLPGGIPDIRVSVEDVLAEVRGPWSVGPRREPIPDTVWEPVLRGRPSSFGASRG
jgi:hypothetical protein